ncbi:replication factor A protein, partial [Trifolium medium]|nr:replication factor A protein [Trifolium medium]
GNKIQATIPPQLVCRFAHLIKENHVYVIYYFRVVENCDGSSFSHNKHRLLFRLKTVLVTSHSTTIDHYGLSFLGSNEILTRKVGFNCLVDAIGVLMTYQFDLEDPSSDGKTSVVKFELADMRGRFPCAFSGKYVDEFREMLSKSSNVHPTVVLQFAKISTDRGFVCVENIEDLTRVMFNPMIPPVFEFNIRYSYCS